ADAASRRGLIQALGAHMTQFWRSVAVVAVPGAILWLGLVGYAFFDAYVLGNCDPKFGCAGNVQVFAFVASLAWCCSLAGHVPACFIFRNVVRSVKFWQLIGAVIGLTIGQGILFALSGSHLPDTTVLGMMAAWAGLSALCALF